MEKRRQQEHAATLAMARMALSRGDVAMTELHCKSLIASAPQIGSAWALLAETALIRNRPDAAKVCADRAVALAPRDPIARIMQAKALLASGQIADALRAAEEAAPLVGAAADAADALAAIFGLLGRHGRALEFSTRAVAASPDNAQYLFNLAATERILGSLSEAEAHCDRALACNPGYALAHYVRSDLRIHSPEDNHISEMEELLERGGLDWRSETMVRYALAKECENIEEHHRAFAHVTAGAQLWRRHIEYDAGADIAEIDRIIQTQDARWLASIAKSGAADAPVFVCGLPRTGTTLVERIIASHSSVDSVGETGIFAIEVARALRANPKAPDPEAIGRNYIGAVKGVFGTQKRHFVDKTLRNYLYCGLIHAALPNAKIIMVERRPMDVAWALYKAHFSGGFLFSYDLAELADYYLAYRRMLEHWKHTLPSEAIMTVSYEDIVGDFQEESGKILDFIGLARETAALRFHECRAPSATASAVQVRRPIYTTSLDKWRMHAEALAPFQARLSEQETILRNRAISQSAAFPFNKIN
jgi:tetratricopeptide (TPR) repeat protein